MVVGLLEQAFIIGKDSGAFSAFQVARIVTLCIPFMLPGISILPMHLFPKGF